MPEVDMAEGVLWRRGMAVSMLGAGVGHSFGRVAGGGPI